MRILLFNLATDLDDPILGFTTHWIWALAQRVERIYVITMRTGRVEMPANVQVYSVGKELGYSEPRRLVEFYRHLWRILRHDRIDLCFSHMMPLFTVLGCSPAETPRYSDCHMVCSPAADAAITDGPSPVKSYGS